MRSLWTWMTMTSSVKYVLRSVCPFTSFHLSIYILSSVHFTQASSSAANSIEATPVHHDTNDPPQSEQDDDEWEVLQPCPEYVKEKRRSQSSSELLSLHTEVILDRPESADGKRKGSLYIFTIIIY